MDFDDFCTNIPDTAGHQMALKFPPHPTSVSTLPGKTQLMRYYILYKALLSVYSNNTRKSHLVYISVTLAESLSSCSTAYSKCLKCRPFTQTQACLFSPFLDSRVDNVLLQTNPDFNQLLLEFIHFLEVLNVV